MLLMWNCGLLKDSQPELLREKKPSEVNPTAVNVKKKQNKETVFDQL